MLFKGGKRQQENPPHPRQSRIWGAQMKGGRGSDDRCDRCHLCSDIGAQMKVLAGCARDAASLPAQQVGREAQRLYFFIIIF